VIVYIWDDAHGHWPANPNAQPEDGSNPRAHASGLDLFVAAHERLRPSATARRTRHWSTQVRIIPLGYRDR
jgi:hypothetical protein